MAAKVTVNFAKIEPGLRRKIRPEILLPAMSETANRIGSDSLHEEPRPPIKKGDLRGSLNVYHVKDFIFRIAYTMKYALRLHETPVAKSLNWPSREIDSGVGPFWLSSKLKKFGDFYNRFLADAIGKRK